MIRRLVNILAALAILGAILFAIKSIHDAPASGPVPVAFSAPPAEERPPPVVTTSPQAPATSPRPQARECAGTVTNNPAIQDWRRSIGC